MKKRIMAMLFVLLMTVVTACGGGKDSNDAGKENVEDTKKEEN